MLTIRRKTRQKGAAEAAQRRRFLSHRSARMSRPPASTTRSMASGTARIRSRRSGHIWCDRLAPSARAPEHHHRPSQSEGVGVASRRAATGQGRVAATSGSASSTLSRSRRRTSRRSSGCFRSKRLRGTSGHSPRRDRGRQAPEGVRAPAAPWRRERRRPAAANQRLVAGSWFDQSSHLPRVALQMTYPGRGPPHEGGQEGDRQRWGLRAPRCAYEAVAAKGT